MDDENKYQTPLKLTSAKHNRCPSASLKNLDLCYDHI